MLIILSFLKSFLYSLHSYTIFYIPAFFTLFIANFKAIEEYSVCELRDNIPDHAKNECLDLNDAECLEAAKVYCDSKDSCFGVTWFEDPMSSGYDNNVVYKMCGSPKTKKMGGFFSTMKKAMKGL